MRMKKPIVAIDGPAGAGKSTVARKVAEALGFVLVDTGALYRTVALAAKRRDVAWTDANATGGVARELAEKNLIVLEPGGRVLLAGEDVSKEIRTPDVSMGASTVSAYPDVRAALLDMQRNAGKNGGVVLEGRDIGTVVFPNAEKKFFLTARPEVRARRRCDELRTKGQDADYEATLAEVIKRDDQDTNRAVAPLKQAADAEYVDTSDMTIDDAVKLIVSRIQ
jgi:cytidylate kinase